MLVTPIKTDITFYAGEDRLLECHIKDDSGTAINLNTFSQIIVHVYSYTDGTSLAKFSMAALADHDSANFVVISAVNGRFNCLMMDTVTALAVEDFYKLEIKTFRLADGFEKIYKGILCKYCDADTKNL